LSYRSTPSFAVGGVAWVDVDGQRYDPPCGYLCFHCGEHFKHWYAARRHFGDPGSNAVPRCVEMRDALIAARRVVADPDVLDHIGRALIPGVREPRADKEALSDRLR
jgi:hypothetical protein